MQRFRQWMNDSVAHKLLVVAVAGLAAATLINLVLLLGPLRAALSSFIQQNRSNIAELQAFQNNLDAMKADIEQTVGKMAEENGESLLADVKKTLDGHLSLFKRQTSEALDQWSSYLIEENAKTLLLTSDLFRIVVLNPSENLEVARVKQGAPPAVLRSSDWFDLLAKETKDFSGTRQVTRKGEALLESVEHIPQHQTTVVLHLNISKVRELIDKKKKEVVTKMGQAFTAGTAPLFDKVGFVATNAERTGRTVSTKTTAVIFVIALLNTILILAGMWFSKRLSAQLTQPLIDLVQAADALANRREARPVVSVGSDEVARLARAFNAMSDQIRSLLASVEKKNAELAGMNAHLEELVAERTRTIKTILDNVTFGLLICDQNLHIQPGFSASCRDLLGKEFDDSKDFLSLFDLSLRDKENFKVLYEQVFEDLGPEELTLGQLPQRVSRAGAALSLAGKTVRDAKGLVTGVLFCVVDVSALERAEREIAENRALLQVIRSYDRFRDFVDMVSGSLSQLRHAISRDDESDVRHELHTYKGNFGAFGLHGMSSLIHEIEEESEVTQNHLDELEIQLRNFLDKNFDILGIRLGDSGLKAVHKIADADLIQFESKLVQAHNLGEVKAHALALVETIRSRSVQDLLGPLELQAKQLATRFNKRIDIQVKGADLLLPASFKSLFLTFLHLVRNSLDHGIELPSERGPKGPVGHLLFDFQRTREAWVFIFADDGKGIQLEAVSRKALDMGLVTPLELAALDDGGRRQLIFKSGLSTAREVSEISGRGSGMAAVLKEVELLGGQVVALPGDPSGTRIEIHIPLAAQIKVSQTQAS